MVYYKSEMRQKGFITPIVIILLAIALGIVGYLAVSNGITNRFFPTLQSAQVAPKNTIENQLDTCSLISDSVFRSVNKYEVGLGPNGPAMGYWSVTFKNNSFQWHHSDVVESGTYTCKDNTVQVQFYKRSTTASYDAGRKILLWEGAEYKKAE